MKFSTGAKCLSPARRMRPERARQHHRERNRRGGDRGDVHHDVGHRAVGELADARDRVLLLHVDHRVGAERERRVEAQAVGGRTGDDHRARAGGPRRHQARQALVAGPLDHDGVAELHAGAVHPVHRVGERLEHRELFGRDRLRAAGAGWCGHAAPSARRSHPTSPGPSSAPSV